MGAGFPTAGLSDPGHVNDRGLENSTISPCKTKQESDTNDVIINGMLYMSWNMDSGLYSNDFDGMAEGEYIEENGMEASLSRPSPTLPSKEEVDDHNRTHLPYRDWCGPCVAAKAIDGQHATGASDAHEPQVDTIAIDYGFLGTDDSDDLIPVLVVKDRKSKAIFSHPVTAKGCSCEWAIDRLIKDIEGLGIRKCILKSDQEPAILAYKRAVIQKREHETIPENVPVEESRANGLVENAVRQAFAQARTLKAALDKGLGKKIPAEATILLWLIEYSGVLLSRYSVGRDGLTAYRRIKGKKCGKPIAEFGESIFFRKRKKTKGKLQKLEPKWESGIFVGIDGRSGELLIGTGSGVFKSHSFRRKPMEDRWGYDAAASIKGTPWNLHEDDDDGE